MYLLTGALLASWGGPGHGRATLGDRGGGFGAGGRIRLVRLRWPASSSTTRCCYSSAARGLLGGGGALGGGGVGAGAQIHLVLLGCVGAGLLLSFGAVSIRPASVRRCILRRPSASPASGCSSPGRRAPGRSCALWGRLISAQIRCAAVWTRKIRAARALKMPSWFVGCSRSGCKILARLGRRRRQRRLWLSFSSRRCRRGAVFQPQTSCFVVSG